MSPIAHTLPNDHASLTWPIQSFTINHTFKSASYACILLDRATLHFGVFYPLSAGTALMAQHLNDDPIFFPVSRTRAACSRPGQKCMKEWVLVQDS
jgi:histone acetyltransferase HTATIP